MQCRDRVERNEEQNAVKGHTAAVQRHTRVVVVPIIAVDMALGDAGPRSVEWMADKTWHNGEDDQVDALKDNDDPESNSHARHLDGECAIVEKENRDADASRHGGIDQGGANNALFFYYYYY